MTLGAPCPTCRKPMTWVPAAQQWSCAPCGAMFAAQPVMLPAFPMAMQPNKSKLPLVVGALAVVGAGVAIALIAMRHKPTAAKPMLADEPAAVPAVDAPKPKPAPPPTPTPIARWPDSFALDHPEMFGLGDFWIWHREDNASAIRSRLFEVAFPHKPVASYANGYVMTDDLAGRGLLSLTVIAGKTDAKAFSTDPIKRELAALGPVTENKRIDRGTDVAIFDAKGASESARTEVWIDTAHGLVLVARAKIIASDQPFADAFFASVHLRPAPPDPYDDAKTLVVRVKQQKGKYQAHDALNNFTLELPWATKVKRVLEPSGLRSVQVTVDSRRGSALATLIVHEMSDWDSLADTPPNQASYIEETRMALEKDTKATVKVAQETLAGVPTTRLDAKARGHSLHQHMLWNRYQHRLYILQCTDAPCDTIALSLAFPQAPVPVQ